MQTALGKSVHYLGFATEADGTYADEDDEDICIAYQLYLEAGRLINLHDWFVGFAEIAGQGGRVPEQQVLARFIRCITELQWLGFVRSTKRKTDHVQRMTWGA